MLEIQTRSHRMVGADKTTGAMASAPWNGLFWFNGVNGTHSGVFKIRLQGLKAMGNRAEVTDQDILAPDCSPIHPKLLEQSRFKPCLWPGCFLLRLSDCLSKACMLLAGLRVQKTSIGDPSKSKPLE